MWSRMRQRIPGWCERVSNLWLRCVNMNMNMNKNFLLLFIIPRTSWLWSPFLLSDVVNLIIICYVFITFLIKLFFYALQMPLCLKSNKPLNERFMINHNKATEGWECEWQMNGKHDDVIETILTCNQTKNQWQDDVASVNFITLHLL